MISVWKQLRSYGKSLWNYFFHRLSFAALYRAIHVEDDTQLPKHISTHIVYIIGVPGNEWLAKMVCPCGCCEILFLNLLQDESPSWKWHIDTNGTVTLSPSVWRQIGCKSHFILRNGLIKWCKPESTVEKFSS